MLVVLLLLLAYYGNRYPGPAGLSESESATGHYGHWHWQCQCRAPSYDSPSARGPASGACASARRPAALHAGLRLPVTRGPTVSGSLSSLRLSIAGRCRSAKISATYTELEEGWLRLADKLPQMAMWPSS